MALTLLYFPVRANIQRKLRTTKVRAVVNRAKTEIWVGLRLVALLGVLGLVMAGPAQANLILSGPTPATSFVDLGAQGFGTAPRLLTTQGSGQDDFLSGKETPIDVEHGAAIDGANKSTTPTIAATGWTSGAQVGIGFNSDQSGNTGITMQDLILTIYNGTTAVGSFALGPAFINFSPADLALQQGNGNAVFDFKLDAAQQAQFNTILASPGSSGFFVGLQADLGCPAGAPAGCMVTNDGPDSFVAFQQSAGTPVPEPGTLLLLGTGLVSVAGFARKKLHR